MRAIRKMALHLITRAATADVVASAIWCIITDDTRTTVIAIGADTRAATSAIRYAAHDAISEATLKD